jgi:hypothetical protein
MRQQSHIFRSAAGAILLLLCIAAAATAATTSTSGSTSTSTSGSTSSSTTLSPEQALAQIGVTSVTLDPVVFYPYETGTVTVQLTNSGSQSVALRSADLIDEHIVVRNGDAYDTMV